MDKKYLYLKQSDVFPDAGEGAFAKRNVPANTIYSLYSGKLYHSKEIKTLEMDNKLCLDEEWCEDELKNEYQWMYKMYR